MREYENLEELIAKIEAKQKGKEGMPEFGIGEQLKDIARAEPASAELLDQDLDKEEMSLETVAKKFQKYADENRKKQKVFCITPITAENLLREFYGLPERDAALTPAEEKPSGFIDLSSFLG